MPFPAKLNAEQIVRTAAGLLEENAEEVLSMRLLAKHLNVKAPSLYRYFSDKEALEFALINYGAKALRTELENAFNTLSTEKAFWVTAETYLQFARNHPALYTLMMSKTSAPVSEAKKLWNFVLSVVSELSHKEDDTSAAVAFWSFLHGYSVLERSNMFGESGPKDGLELGLKSLAKGFSSD